MLHLTLEERDMLAGGSGPAARKAMEIVVALAKIYEADRLVAVEHVQVAGVSYKNLGDAGLDFLRGWAEEGARVRVPTTLNPAGMDMARWQEMGIPAAFAERQHAVVDAYLAMGIQPTLTCTPYLVGHRPRLGAHLAWSESSAVSFANSVLGARTNREGGPSALASAITGKTPNSGYHLEANRKANYLVLVRCPVEAEVDFGALGYLVGKAVSKGVPYFRFEVPSAAIAAGSASREDRLKTLGAAMAASGAVAIYHIEGVTPEACDGENRMLCPNADALAVDSLDEGFSALNGPMPQVDFVSIGCPHASLAEIEQIARALDGCRVVVPLWVATALHTRDAAKRRGWIEDIERAGGSVVADTCVVVAPIELLGYRSVATNSAKAAFYLPSHGGVEVRFGPLEQCISASLTGRWMA